MCIYLKLKGPVLAVTGTSTYKWKTGTSGPRTIRPSSNVSPSGPLSDRAAFHPGVQPLLPCGVCRGRACALRAQHGLLHSGCARLQGSFPEGVSGSVFSLFYPPFDKTWKQFHIWSFFYTLQLLRQLLQGRREFSTNVYICWKNSLTTCFTCNYELCASPFFHLDTWRRFPGW